MPRPSATVNGMVMFPLRAVSAPLAVNVPVSGEPPASVRLEGPENVLVPDVVIGAFVTEKVKLWPLFVPEIEKLSAPLESTEPVKPDPETVVSIKIV